VVGLPRDAGLFCGDGNNVLDLGEVKNLAVVKGMERPAKRKAVVSMKFFEKQTPLLQSGMMGQVVLRIRVHQPSRIY
jgi:hypothetical protein